VGPLIGCLSGSLKELQMPVIKPRTEEAKKLVRHRSLLAHENHQTLIAYATFINEPVDYVVNEVIATVLAKDPEFKKWRSGQVESAGVNTRAIGKNGTEARSSDGEAKTPLAVTDAR
jgi:L,D-peptidoglycan transpeptidase YkuD (ErfK/YbiS/YcfS/YnhG family)